MKLLHEEFDACNAKLKLRYGIAGVYLYRSMGLADCLRAFEKVSVGCMALR